MANAPICRHPAAASRRFVLVVRTTIYKDLVKGQMRPVRQERRLILRRIAHVAAVGQLQPIVQVHETPCVPRPNSADFKQLVYRRISYGVHQRLFPADGRTAEPIRLNDLMASEGWPEALKKRVQEALRVVADEVEPGVLWAPREDRRLKRASCST